MRIVIKLLVMGAPETEKIFHDKDDAKEFFEKYFQSVCCYPLVEVDGVEFKNLLAACRFFGVRGSQRLPEIGEIAGDDR